MVKCQFCLAAMSDLKLRMAALPQKPSFLLLPHLHMYILPRKICGTFSLLLLPDTTTFSNTDLVLRLGLFNHSLFGGSCKKHLKVWSCKHIMSSTGRTELSTPIQPHTKENDYQKELRFLKPPYSLLPPETCVNPPNSSLGRLRQKTRGATLGYPVVTSTSNTKGWTSNWLSALERRTPRLGNLFEYKLLVICCKGKEALVVLPGTLALTGRLPINMDPQNSDLGQEKQPVLAFVLPPSQRTTFFSTSKRETSRPALLHNQPYPTSA